MIIRNNMCQVKSEKNNKDKPATARTNLPLHKTARKKTYVYLYESWMPDGTKFMIRYRFKSKSDARLWRNMVKNLMDTAQRIEDGNFDGDSMNCNEEDGWSMWLSACQQFINHWGFAGVPDNMREDMDYARACAFGDGPLEPIEWPPSGKIVKF